MSDNYGSIHCTEFDIVEEGQVPFLMSLPQMRNLRFSLNLTPGNASLTCDPLGIYHLPLDTSRSSHLVLDLEVMAEYMYNVEFQVQRVSFFTQNVHYDYSNRAQEEPAQESGLAHQQDETSANPQPSEEALVSEDKWVLNEPNKEMIRVHRKLRSQSYKPEKNNTPIPLEYLEDTRATKFEYEDGTSQQKVDKWRGKDAPKVVRQEKPWKATTIFKVKPGGFERRTNVRVSISVGTIAAVTEMKKSTFRILSMSLRPLVASRLQEAHPMMSYLAKSRCLAARSTTRDLDLHSVKSKRSVRLSQ